MTIAAQFIAEQEGFRSAPYPDSAGNWTIGYGFTYNPDGTKVTAETPPVSQEAAFGRLETLVASVESLVRGLVRVPVTENQIAALTSFAYNIGTNALKRSTLLEELNAGNPNEAAANFASWVHAGGKFSQGLANRRAAERTLFLMPDTSLQEAQTTPSYLSSADKLMDAELQQIKEQEQP